jgi:hypothetical protein
LYVALLQAGEEQRASRMLREYLMQARREVRRCNYWLRARTSGDEVWSDPSARHLA